MEVFTFCPKAYFGSNCYVIKSDDKYAIIDPSVAPDEILCSLPSFCPEYIILTHAHFDHILFVDEFKARFPQKTVWCYTGCVLDEKTGALVEKDKNTEYTKELISLFDVLVDGPFVEELKDIRLKFRGSSNQRVIDVKKTLEKGECVLYLE